MAVLDTAIFFFSQKMPASSAGKMNVVTISIVEG
jgi:hypothetical protein